MAQAPQGIASLPAANDVQRVMGGGQMARRQRPDVPPMSRAQALNFLGAMTGVGGYADILGQYPQMPAEDVTVSEMLQGPPGPSLAENLREGQYLDASLQALGAIPFVGAAAKGARAGRLVRSTSDASDTFGKGAQEITLSDPVSGGRIKLLARPGKPNSVLSLYVDEAFRGQGVGKALQDAALAEGPLMGQVSSKAAAVNAYRAGRRPVDNPNASLEDVFAAIDRDSSVNMATPDLLPSAALKGPRAFQRALQLASAKQLPAEEVEGLYRTLLEIGYPEPTAAKIARGDLPMDEASRMARARETGFDPEQVFYHGTSSDFMEFRPSTTGEFGPGVYMSTSPVEAGGYAPTNAFRGNAGQNIIPLKAKTDKLFDANARDFWSVFSGSTDQEVVEAAKRAGYEGVKYRRPVSYWDDEAKRIVDTGEMQEHVVIFDPENVRSVNAAFDPDQVDSPNLMAGVAPYAVPTVLGGSLLGAAGAPEEAEAAQAPKEMEDGGAVPKGIGALPAANDVQRALLARETGSYVMTPAGPVPQQDPLLTEAQFAYFAGSFLPGAGALEASGAAPEYPTSDMQFADMLRGPRAASLKENIEEGNYGTATLQGLSVLGDAASIIPVVGPAAGAVLKAPRAVQRVARSAFKPDLDSWGGKFDPEKAQAQAEILEKEAPRFSDAVDLAGFLTDRIDDEYKPIANRVRDRLDFMKKEQGFNFPLTVFHVYGNPVFGSVTHDVPAQVMKPSAAGVAKMTNFEVGVFLKGRDVAKAQKADDRFGTDFETALHELIHAATLPTLEVGSLKKAGVPISPKLFEFRNDLAGLQGYLATHLNQIGKEAQALSAKNKKSPLENVEHPLAKAILGNKTNALKNIDETLAWGMSNPRVKKYLDSIPYDPVKAEPFNLAPYDTFSAELLRRAEPVLDDRSPDLVEGILRFNPKAQQFAEGGEVKKEGPSVWDAMVAAVLKYLDLPPKDFPALKKLMEPKDVSRPLEDEEDG